MRGNGLPDRSIWKEYSFVLDARVVLDAIVEMGRKSKRKKSVLVNLIGPNRLLKIEVNDKGESQILQGPLVEALVGVDARRIRQCPICSDFFWAGRIDQPCCTSQCAHILRTRRWRENYLERYKLRRDERTSTVERNPRSAPHQRKPPKKASL
jgi:hypothetical protein